MERKAYTALGFLLLATVLYFNWISSGSGGRFRIRIPIPWLQPKMGFVGRNGTHFVEVEDGTPVYVNGWNSYWLISSKLEEVSEMFRRGRAMGMTVCRTWAFSDGGANGLQISPGRFNERLFQALDFVIYDARRNNIRLILCLVNNLNAFGGKAQYVRWAQAAGANVTSTDSFFSDPTIKHYYKDYVEAWIAEMASHIKSLDKKHMVTVGLEGFYGHGRTERLGANPGEWASSLGSDFIQNSADENIDFASVHAYPDSWIPKASFEEKVKYLSNWVDYHVNDSEHVLKKPVLFGEVGFHLEGKKNGSYDRDIILKLVYDKLYESAKKGEAGAGALIWQLMIEETQVYKDEFSLVASRHPSTYKLILQQSCRLRKLFRRKRKTKSNFWPCTNP
ncbi:hypothetical protein KFK09_016648 [Dendrobium nobile]|uniref:mannan endo-1,4-beta-mannosidase n=1 Tax=Dendrobium nobile TaxID=94219 RepID=A0A8T3AYT8_DENNO|nr:hypothetical protein KFK09_016648 [Dendrobium nobile]